MRALIALSAMKRTLLEMRWDTQDLRPEYLVTLHAKQGSPQQPPSSQSSTDGSTCCCCCCYTLARLNRTTLEDIAWSDHDRPCSSNEFVLHLPRPLNLVSPAFSAEPISCYGQPKTISLPQAGSIRPAAKLLSASISDP